MVKNKMMVIGICVLMLIIIISSGCTEEKKETKKEYDEARVRKIMADMTLGGPVSYYRDHPDDPNSVEAVKRWDAGVRVTNADLFERKKVDGTWRITYKGTDTAINGMDVILTTD